MTDNGTAAGARFDAAGFLRDGYNAGLRGGKGSPYDGGHRVPFFLRYPRGALCGGRDTDTLCAHIDVMPTLLDLCNVPTPRALSWHGRSLAPVLRDAAAPWPERTLVTDSQRLTEPVKWRQSAVMSDRWRLIDGAKLYDIRADREQRRDLATQHPTEVTRLRAAYEEWWAVVSQQAARNVPIALGDETGDNVERARLAQRSERLPLAPGAYPRRPPQRGLLGSARSCGRAATNSRCAAGRKTPAMRSQLASMATMCPGARIGLRRSGIIGIAAAPPCPSAAAPSWNYGQKPLRRPTSLYLPCAAAAGASSCPPMRTEARFCLHLPVGDYRLSARFLGPRSAGTRFCGEGGLRVGAYYVRVEYLGA